MFYAFQILWEFRNSVVGGEVNGIELVEFFYLVLRLFKGYSYLDFKKILGFETFVLR